MKNVKTAAQRYVGLSHCDKCNFYRICSLKNMEYCRNNSIKAFMAGVKWGKNQLRKSNTINKTESS